MTEPERERERERPPAFSYIYPLSVYILTTTAAAAVAATFQTELMQLSNVCIITRNKATSRENKVDIYIGAEAPQIPCRLA